MLNVKEVKQKLGGKDLHWYVRYDRTRWDKIVPKIKRGLLRDLWEVSLWDRLCGRDIPHCSRCKEEIFDMPRYISTSPLCDCCYDDFVCEAINDGEQKHGEDRNDDEGLTY